MVERWSQLVRAVGFYVNNKPTASTIMVCELCISDCHKPLLLANAAFIPYVVDALLLVRANIEHPLTIRLTALRDDCFTVAALSPDE